MTYGTILAIAALATFAAAMLFILKAVNVTDLKEAWNLQTENVALALSFVGFLFWVGLIAYIAFKIAPPSDIKGAK